MAALIGVIAFLAFFTESIFGFGGTIIFLGIAGLFYDFKTLVYLSISTGMVVSATIVAQSYKDISLTHLKKLLLLTPPFVAVGIYLAESMASQNLLKFFAGFLIFYGCFEIFFSHIRIPTAIRYALVALGAAIQGIFTTGGPFILMGYKNSFDNKSQLRTTMAAFFLISNMIRFAFSMYHSGAVLDALKEFFWIPVPIILAVFAGYAVHVRVPEKIFKNVMTAGIILIGVVLLLR